MVWAAVASGGSNPSLVFIEKCIKVNTQPYMKMLTEKVLPRITESFENRYVFTQNSTPSHTSNWTLKLCKDNFSGFWDENIRLPLSPNIKPLDFTIWFILEGKVSTISYSNVAAMKYYVFLHGLLWMKK